MSLPAKRIGLIVAVLGLVLGLPSINRAGSILSVSIDGVVLAPGETGSGPGGTATFLGLRGTNGAVFSKDFTSINPIDITVTVDSGGLYSIDELLSPEALIRNHTRLPWKDFEFILMSAPTGSSFDSAVESPIPSERRFAEPVVTANLVTFAGGTVAINDSFRPLVTLNITGSGPASFTVRQLPTVPEPSSFVLLGMGVLSIAGIAWCCRPRAVYA